MNRTLELAVTMAGLIVSGECALWVESDQTMPDVYGHWYMHDGGAGASWRTSMYLPEGEMALFSAPCDIVLTALVPPGFGTPLVCGDWCRPCGPGEWNRNCAYVTLNYSGPLDQTLDGRLDSEDVMQFLELNAKGVDFNGDGRADTQDVADYVALWGK